MAWKLKKSQTSAGTEAPVAPVDPGAAAQFDRAAAGHDDAHTDRTVMVLGDDDYLSGLMPTGANVDPAHGSAGSGSREKSDLFPAASENDLDRYLRGDSGLASQAHDSAANGAIELDSPTAGGDYDDEVPHRQAIELDDSLLGAPPASQMAAAAAGPAGDEIDPLPADPSSNRTVMYIDNLPDESAPARPAMDLDDEPAVARPAIDLDDRPAPARPAMDLDEAPVGLGEVPTSNPFMAPPVVQAPARPAAPAAPAMAASTPPAPEPDFLSSAINESDEAVASFRSATQDKPAPPPAPATPVAPATPQAAAPAAPAAAAGMENWDLDAFAPYQPPGGGAAARPAVEAAAPAPSPAASAPPVEESLVGAVSASRLIVRLGQFSASYELTKAETTVGRPDPRTKVFPDVAVEWDDAVSRNHCRILHRQDGDYLEDTGSTNGTKLNDKMIPPYVTQLLSDGDRIGVGEKTEITYIK